MKGSQSCPGVRGVPLGLLILLALLHLCLRCRLPIILLALLLVLLPCTTTTGIILWPWKEKGFPWRCLKAVKPCSPRASQWLLVSRREMLKDRWALMIMGRKRAVSGPNCCVPRTRGLMRACLVQELRMRGRQQKFSDIYIYTWRFFFSYLLVYFFIYWSSSFNDFYVHWFFLLGRWEDIT